MIRKIKFAPVVGILAAAVLMFSGCGAFNTGADAGSDTATEETEKESREDKEDKEEQEEKDEPLAGSYWVSEGFGTNEGYEAELFFFEDGSFYYREPRIDESGIRAYQTIGARYLTFKEDGKKIEFKVKWGYADENSDEDVNIYTGTYKKGKIKVVSLIERGGEEHTFVRSEMPDLPSCDDAPKMVGEWRMFASVLEGGFEIYGEDDWFRKYVQVTEKDGKYYASGQKVEDGECTGSWNDIGMTLKDEPVYDGFYNSFWRADLDEETDDGIWREITLYNDNILTLVESNYHDDVNQDYVFISYQFYVREDGNEDEYIRDFVCPVDVTVSDIHELASAIRPGANITLKGGTYNFSDLTSEDQTGWLQCYDTDELSWYLTVGSLSISAADGEDVEIVTNDPYAPVIDMTDCYGVWFDGLTSGHLATPGGCGASVINMYNCDHIYINDCNLYGCGIYGISAGYSKDVIAKRTDIFDCSVGAVSLYDSSSLTMYDCSIYENTGYDLFSIYGNCFLSATGCDIEDNEMSSSSLVYAGDNSTAYFTHCSFTDNIYEAEYETDKDCEVTFTNCSFD